MSQIPMPAHSESNSADADCNMEDDVQEKKFPSATVTEFLQKANRTSPSAGDLALAQVQLDRLKDRVRKSLLKSTVLVWQHKLYQPRPGVEDNHLEVFDGAHRAFTNRYDHCYVYTQTL